MRQVSINTLFAISPDGARIAYERIGTGLPLVLLHGGGNNRHMWYEAGYVERLQNHFTVIIPDLRGHGESDSPTDPSDYTTDKMVQDILAVVGTCGFESFMIWGFSFGGKVGRYVAVHSERVTKIVLMGTPLGAFISNEFRQYMAEFCAHWTPILQADKVLDASSLSKDDREFLENNNVAAMMAWGQAMLKWTAIEPGDFHCPVLWLVGSEDQVTMVTVRQYKQLLPDSKVQLHIVDGLDHGQVFSEIDRVLDPMLSFSQA
jgi:pimeloyl-ACP methyl ester carboxylesterase